eukprot:3117258-Amphidinium_carterae.1
MVKSLAIESAIICTQSPSQARLNTHIRSPLKYAEHVMIERRKSQVTDPVKACPDYDQLLHPVQSKALAQEKLKSFLNSSDRLLHLRTGLAKFVALVLLSHRA